ncbi:hypothetical protein LZ32DRAFT_109394 [Colletotrichum eremochloae]|nr:hypothetical protein LZ32DRAFT_109394 [Colletotrichum eremochloae]
MERSVMDIASILADENTGDSPFPQDETSKRVLCGGYLIEPQRTPVSDACFEVFDMFDTIIRIARKGETPQAVRALDIKTNTGIWPISFVESNRESIVTGIDTHRMHPQTYQSNVVFHTVDRIEGPWQLWEQDFDLVHYRLLFDTPINLAMLYENSFGVLQSGGVLELEVLDWELSSDDNTIPRNSYLAQWVDKIKRSRQHSDVKETKAQLERNGFIDVQVERINLPINPGKMDHDENDISAWFHSGLCALLEASRSTQTPPEWVIPKDGDLAAKVKEEIRRVSIHAYMKLYVWRARKP